MNNSGDKNDYFTVQKFNVTTGEYTDMETTNSRTTTGLSQYTVYDITPDNGDNIYRIKLVQIDGTVYISDLKTVNFNTENITIFPNPVEDNINIAFKGYENKAIDITLYNMQGQPIMTRQIAKMESDLVTMPVGEKMVAGQYMLRIKTNGKRETLKSFTVGK